MRLGIATIATAAIISALSACGGDEEAASPTAAPSPTASPTVAPTTPAATGELTLDIESLEPGAVRLGDSVTVVYVTRARAYIGLQVVDGAGNIVVQDMVTAGSDGRAPYDFVAEGEPGSWMISAAAGATLADLYLLQASPVPGPNTIDREFEVQ